MRHFLYTFCWLLLLSACADTKQDNNSSDIPAEEKTATVPSPEYDDQKGVDLMIDSVILRESSYTLKVRFKNSTNKTYTIGEEYYLKSWTGEDWQKVDTGREVAFIDIGYILKPLSDYKNNYKLSIIYPDLHKGYYQFVTNVLYVREPGDYDKLTESVVFEIK